MKVGYTRTGKKDQNPGIHKRDLEAFGRGRGSVEYKAIRRETSEKRRVQGRQPEGE